MEHLVFKLALLRYEVSFQSDKDMNSKQNSNASCYNYTELYE